MDIKELKKVTNKKYNVNVALPDPRFPNYHLLDIYDSLDNMNRIFRSLYLSIKADDDILLDDYQKAFLSNLVEENIYQMLILTNNKYYHNFFKIVSFSKLSAEVYKNKTIFVDVKNKKLLVVHCKNTLSNIESHINN